MTTRPAAKFAGTAGAAPRPAPQAPKPPVVELDPNQFLVRLAISGEVFKIYDLHMLKEWILGRKVTREDAISKEGNVWKPLGSVAELQPIFRELDQEIKRESSRPKPAPTIQGMGEQDWHQPDLALSTTAPMSQPRRLPDLLHPVLRFVLRRRRRPDGE